MKKVDKSVADAYFRARNILIIICLVIGYSSSYGVAFFATDIYESGALIMGMPAHYYMAAQGSVITFILMLIVNAVVSDKIDKKFGIDEEANARVSSGKVLDH